MYGIGRVQRKIDEVLPSLMQFKTMKDSRRDAILKQAILDSREIM